MTTAILRNELSPLDAILADADSKREARRLYEEAVLQSAEQGCLVAGFVDLCFQASVPNDVAKIDLQQAAERFQKSKEIEGIGDLEKQLQDHSDEMEAAEAGLAAGKVEYETKRRELENEILGPRRERLDNAMRVRQEIDAKIRRRQRCEQFLWKTADPAIDEEARLASGDVYSLQNPHPAAMSASQMKELCEQYKTQLADLEAKGEKNFAPSKGVTFANDETRAAAYGQRVESLRNRIAELEADIARERQRPALIRAAQERVNEIQRQRYDWRRMRWQ